MDYQVQVKGILKELGMYKMYKGCEYIVSCIDYIQRNEKAFLPMTKILYVDVAKEHNTSGRCVERDMRNVITAIWQKGANEALMREIFGECNIAKRPTNMEFLMLLYNHVKYNVGTSETMLCPFCGVKCKHCSEFAKHIV